MQLADSHSRWEIIIVSIDLKKKKKKKKKNHAMFHGFMYTHSSIVKERKKEKSPC